MTRKILGMIGECVDFAAAFRNANETLNKSGDGIIHIPAKEEATLWLSLFKDSVDCGRWSPNEVKMVLPEWDPK